MIDQEGGKVAATADTPAPPPAKQPVVDRPSRWLPR